MISSSTSAKRSVAWPNSPLHELLCVSQKVACLTCALICDWRRHSIANQSWLQMPALLDFSISFVVNDTAELEVDPAPALSLCLRKQCGCGWAVHRLAWQQRAQRAHEEHVVLSMNDFDEQPLSQTRKSKILDFLKRHLSLLACGQSTRCLAQNRRIVSDFRHLGVWNFRRIVFHASLQVESSCYRFILCWSPGHDIDKRQRKISRVARHSCMAPTRARPRPRPKLRSAMCAPKTDQRASTNVRS